MDKDESKTPRQEEGEDGQATRVAALCQRSLLRRFTPQVEGQLLGSQENQPDKCVQGGIGGLQREIKGYARQGGGASRATGGRSRGVCGVVGDGTGRDGIQTTSKLSPIPYMTTFATKASVTQ